MSKTSCALAALGSARTAQVDTMPDDEEICICGHHGKDHFALGCSKCECDWFESLAENREHLKEIEEWFTAQHAAGAALTDVTPLGGEP